MAGFIFYRGASLLDNSPIVGIAIITPANKKTGNMVQTYILKDNGKSPLDNVKTGDDSTICGDCKHRRFLGGSCYVNIGQGPAAVFKAMQRGNYPENIEATRKALKGKAVRLGAYGDPAAIPYDTWAKILELASGFTGYTHAWKNPNFDKRLMTWCMASVDNVGEKIEAVNSGFRYFRVRGENETILPREFVCPASAEGGKRLLCDSCQACNGGINSTKANPVIVVHGTLKSRFIPIMSA